MKGPVKIDPFAVCDRKSVKIDDQVPFHLYGVTPFGAPFPGLNLRQNPDHMWYYYPDMTNDETIAFIQFENTKDGPYTEVQTVFHTAFSDPASPSDAEKRKSCEFRTEVFLK